MNRPPETNREIVESFGVRAFGELCGFEKNPIQRAMDMVRRDSIPSRHWHRIAEAAAARGIAITIESLEQVQRAARQAKAKTQRARRQAKAA